MGQITVLRIHNRGLQQFLGENRLGDGFVRVADIAAVPVIIYLAAGSDLLDGIRQEADPVQLEEVRQIFGLDVKLDHPVAEDFDPFEIGTLAGHIFFVSS